jgi:hypothetical protein
MHGYEIKPEAWPTASRWLSLSASALSSNCGNPIAQTDVKLRSATQYRSIHLTGAPFVLKAIFV